MKKRVTALTLALALMVALGAAAVFAEDGAEISAAETAETETTAGGTAGDAGETGTAVPEAADARPEETAEATGPEKPELDPEGTLSFANLGSRMRRSYYPIMALEESVRTIEEIDYERMENDLREQLNDIASMQWTMISFRMSESDEFQELDQAYAAMRAQFDAIRDGDMQKDNADALRQLRNAQNQMIVFGESLYIALKGLESQDAALTRQIAQLDRTIEEMKLRQELGQVSEQTVSQLALGRTRAESGRQTLRMNRDTYLLQLESMVGAELGEPLSLGALPKVTAEQLAAMSLETDLETAKEASYDLMDARKTYEDAQDTYYDAGGDGDRRTYSQMRTQHTFYTAQYTYDNQVLSFELNFRALYAQVKDCAQVLQTARAALAEQEKAYAVSALRHEQGNLSANALSDAKDELAAAKAAVTDAERELFSKYRSYQWAVEYGILNS